MPNSYTINYADPLKRGFALQSNAYDGPGSTSGTHSSLRLYGPSTLNYGEGVDENLLRITENFAGATPPLYPIEGQLWFCVRLYWHNTTSNTWWRWNYETTAWENISAGVTQNPTAPALPSIGSYWFNGTSLQRWDSAYQQTAPRWNERYFSSGTTNPAAAPTQTMMTWNGSQWSSVGTSASLTAPTSPTVGQLWFDLSDGNLKMWDGSEWIVVSLWKAENNGIFYSNGNVKIGGAGARVLGDFSTVAPFSNRVSFQTSTLNGNTIVTAAPNGSSQTAAFCAINSSNLNDASGIQIFTTPTNVGVRTASYGMGPYLPLVLWTNGAERMRIDNGGQVGINQSTPQAYLHVCKTDNNLNVSTMQVEGYGSGRGYGIVMIPSVDFAVPLMFLNHVGSSVGAIQHDATNLQLSATNNLSVMSGGSERMRVTAAGNVGVGTTSPDIFSNTNSHTLVVSKDNYAISFSSTNIPGLNIGTNTISSSSSSFDPVALSIMTGTNTKMIFTTANEVHLVGNRLSNVGYPTVDTDAATKAYVDSKFSNYYYYSIGSYYSPSVWLPSGWWRVRVDYRQHQNTFNSISLYITDINGVDMLMDSTPNMGDPAGTAYVQLWGTWYFTGGGYISARAVVTGPYDSGDDPAARRCSLEIQRVG